MTYGWAGSARDLVAADPGATAHVLAEQHHTSYGDGASGEQRRAWRNELEWLSGALHAIDSSQEWGVALEYELPFEGGRRPDAIVLARDAVLVLEFKEAAAATRADIDQVDAYARDLAEYHSECRGRRVVPILVMVNRSGLHERFEGVPVIGP